MKNWQVKNYKVFKNGTTIKKKVFIYLIKSPLDVLNKNDNPILSALTQNNIGNSIGLYFYRFKDLSTYSAFTKIGEVSRIEGISKRFVRGWHGTETYSDTYLGKGLHRDIELVSSTNPMYFVFYEFDLKNSYPKIDEQLAFNKHLDYFGCGTRNSEKPNGNFELGINLAWYPDAFNEVLNAKFPDGTDYLI